MTLLWGIVSAVLYLIGVSTAPDKDGWIVNLIGALYFALLTIETVIERKMK